MFLSFLPFLAACFLTSGKGEVVKNFANCLEFFLDKRPPRDALAPSTGTPICQLYRDIYRFATLYDSGKRIPIYSAYICKPGQGANVQTWMIEPQLVNPSFGKIMEDEKTTQIPKDQIKKSQAVSDDYNFLLHYNKGHLNPMGHQPDEDSKAAASTSTNTIPLYKKLSENAWRKYEKSVRAIAQKPELCHELYVINGVVPSLYEYVSSNRVNKPSHIWSAACCVHQEKGRTSWAAIAKNSGDRVKEYSLEKLQITLAKLYGKGNVDLFNNACNPAVRRKNFPKDGELAATH